MLDAWNTLSLSVFDSLLGWLLALSPDAALCVVAVGSASLLTLVRRVTTRQDLLRRIAADKRRLRGLIREARARGDREAVVRHRRTKTMVLQRSLKEELLPLAVSIVPIAMLATWCLLRLEFRPPRAGEPVRLAIHAPASSAESLVHVVPARGLRTEGGWVRRLEATTEGGEPHAAATWTLQGEASARPHTIRLRVDGRTLEHELEIGRYTYSAPVVRHGDRIVTAFEFEPLKLFEVVPGFPPLGLPPWLVAYLLAVVCFLPLSRRLFRTC